MIISYQTHLLQNSYLRAINQYNLIMKNNRLLFILSTALFILLLPLIAMQFTNEVNWTLFDFIIAGIILCSFGLLLEFVLRKSKKSEYRIAFIAVLVVGFLLVWAELAVGIFGSPIAGN